MSKAEYETLKSLSRQELMILGAEVNSTGDQEYLDAITDEIKRRNESTK